MINLQLYNRIEVGILLFIVLFDIPFPFLLALITIIILQSKKMMKGAICLLKRDLTGRVAIVTGGNTGIGKQTVIGLVSNGCEVVIAARDGAKSQKVADQIRKQFGDKVKVSCLYLNLSSKKDIDSFVQVITKNYTKIDYLINNAAVMMIPQRRTTEDGFQMQIGTNYLGHFYLTYKLWNMLKNSDDLRIVNLSSSAHYKVFKKVQIDFDDFGMEKHYTPMKGYGASKLAMLIFSQQLARRLQSKYNTARAVSLHPGFVKTQISRYISKSSSIISYTINPISSIFGKSPKQGAQTTLYTILQQSKNLINGGYYDNCNLGFKSPFASVIENQQKLWQISQKLLGIEFKIQ